MPEPPRSERFFERIAANVAVLLGGRLLQKVLSFILVWVLVRWWTTEQFGLYSFLMIWLSLVAGVSDMGMSAVGVRLWAENPGRMARTMPRLYVLRLLFIGIGIAVSVPVWLTLYSQLPIWGLVLVAVGLIPQVQNVALIPFQAELSNWKPTVWSGINRAITVTAIIGAVLFGAGVSAVVLIEIVMPLVLLLKLMTEAGKLSLARKSEEPAFSFRELASDLGPAGLLVLLGMAFFRADVFMLMRLRGEHDVGVYAASFRIVEPLLTLPGVLAMTLTPVAIARHAAGDLDGLWRSIHRAARVITLLQLGIAFALARHANEIVLVLFGPAYAPTAPIMAVLVWTLPLSAWSYAWSMSAMAERRYARLNLLAAAALALNVAGNLWAIPRWGGWGCAVVTIATELLWSIGQSLPYARGHRAWSIAGALVAAGLAAWGASALVDGISTGLVVRCLATASGFIVLAVVSWFSGLVTADDIAGIRSSWNQAARRGDQAPSGPARP